VELAIVDVHLQDMDGYAAVADYARRFPTVCRALRSPRGAALPSAR
jgi:hypothetical protein